ncbi:hypothetical protein Ndes2437B_g08693 [Nannochloris sp. 'desiccata']
MAGKPKAQAKLHKTKTAAPKKGSDAFDKLVTSCNEQLEHIQAMLHQPEFDYSYNQRHYHLKSRADSMAQMLSRSNLSTRLALQKLLGQAESAQRKLEGAKRSLHGSEHGEEILEELNLKMQSSVEQCLAGLSKGAGKKKTNMRQTQFGKGGRGRK